MTHPWLAYSPPPRVLAHRGLVSTADAAAGIVENSLHAVAAADAAGARYIESDCRVTKDGTVVLFHDATLDRVLGIPQQLSQMTVAELAELMEPRGGLLTLTAALEAFPDTRFNLDIKSADAAQPVGQLVGPHADRVLLTSFSDRNRRAGLAAAVAAGGRPATSPGRSVLVRLVAAVRMGLSGTAERILRGVDAVQIPERRGRIPVLSDALLETSHRIGREIHVWTVNNPSDIARLFAAGIDGIVTDHADIALRSLDT